MARNITSEALRFRLAGMLDQGYSYRDIASRSGLSRGEVFGIVHGQHRSREATAERALGGLNRDFTVNVLSERGQRWIDPVNIDGYSLAGQHWSAMKQVIRSNFTDFSSLQEFRGKYIEYIGPAGRERLRLLDDRDAATIRRLGNLGELDPVEVTHGGSGRRRVR